LLIEALFRPGSKLNQEHKSKYMFLLAYASSVCDTYTVRKGASRRSINKDEVKGTMQALEKVHAIISVAKGSMELLAELDTLYKCCKFAVVSVGVIRWVQTIVCQHNYFSLNSDYCPIHLALLDEVVSNHPLLHSSVLGLYMDLFEGSYGQMEILAILEIKKMLVDRLVNLLSRGCVLPVVKYMVKCWQNTDTDISLIRYFVTEVLETIAPPYSLEFVSVFLPLVENEEITGSMRLTTDMETDPVSEFIVHCKAMNGINNHSL